jgi:hypothetical protein
VRRAARKDTTQDAIVDRLKACGVAVEIIGKPLDLLICWRGETSLMECKNPERTSNQPQSRWTKAQVEFIARWPGKIHVVESPDEAVYAVLGPDYCDKPREAA